MVIIRCIEIKIELEWVIFTDIGRETTVLKAVVEDSESAPGDELWIHLIGKSETRREICFLRISQPLAVLVRNVERNSIFYEQTLERS